jgi:hypothetical protein
MKFTTGGFTTKLATHFPLVETILGPWRPTIGRDYPGYRNHVYRLIHICFALRPCNEEEQQRIMVAGCFHDLGIWSAQTFDYLDPSIALAQEYLLHHDQVAWLPEISLMIDLHHQFRPYGDARYPLVELFRRGDWTDVSLGILRFGLPRKTLRGIQRTFPNGGFHPKLVRLTLQRFIKHPLSPIPVLKW